MNRPIIWVICETVGNDNPGIDRKLIAYCKSFLEHRGQDGSQAYVRESNYVIEILAKLGKKLIKSS